MQYIVGAIVNEDESHIRLQPVNDKGIAEGEPKEQLVKDLEIGDKFYSETGGEVWLSNKSYLHVKTLVYNFSVTDEHTYTAEGLAVHNFPTDQYGNVIGTGTGLTGGWGNLGGGGNNGAWGSSSNQAADIARQKQADAQRMYKEAGDKMNAGYKARKEQQARDAGRPMPPMQYLKPKGDIGDLSSPIIDKGGGGAMAAGGVVVGAGAQSQKQAKDKSLQIPPEERGYQEPPVNISGGGEGGNVAYPANMMEMDLFGKLIPVNNYRTTEIAGGIDNQKKLDDVWDVVRPHSPTLAENIYAMRQIAEKNGGGANVTLNIYNPILDSEMRLDELARKVSGVIGSRTLLGVRS